MDVLEDHQEEKALEFRQINRKAWYNLSLVRAMEVLQMNYPCTLSDKQAIILFDKENPAYPGYKEHLNYLMQVNAASGGLLLKVSCIEVGIVHRSGTELMSVILAKCYRHRTD